MVKLCCEYFGSILDPVVYSAYTVFHSDQRGLCLNHGVTGVLRSGGVVLLAHSDLGVAVVGSERVHIFNSCIR